MTVLLITRSDDNPCVGDVARALLARGVRPVRLNTDLYPQAVRLSTRYGEKRDARELWTEEGRFDLGEVTALWYRRFFAGGRLPTSLGDAREPCVEESRRTLYGTIAALGCFELDPLVSVRKADHKELQLTRARALGLDVPRTLFSNDPAAVRAFYEELGGRVVAKMQSSFALYRKGREQVVFTNALKRRDLEALEGLRCAPMTFQEHVKKRIELRATVVGRRVFTAAVDSQAKARTKVDWRRDGVGLLGKWKPYRLPRPAERALLRLTQELGLNYAAADFIVTPEGRHVFLEVNAGGEWFWLQKAPGLPIAEALADVLTGRAERVSPRA